MNHTFATLVVRITARVWLLALLCCVASESRAESYEQTWDVDSDVKIDISTISGRIEIEAGDSSKVVLEARGRGAESLQLNVSRGRVSISGKRRSGWWGGGNVDISLEVPIGSRITARTVNGEIRVEDIEGILDLRTANGRIDGAASRHNAVNNSLIMTFNKALL